jgi:hypothetical protein
MIDFYLKYFQNLSEFSLPEILPPNVSIAQKFLIALLSAVFVWAVVRLFSF